MKEWIFNEKKHCGIDYSSTEVSKAYDSGHQKFRNYKEEAERIIKLLDVEADDVVVDMGCGTGAFVLNAAAGCGKVIAVDISEAMLSRLKEKQRKENIKNVETVRAGFLSYEHKGAKADAVVSMAALHHLPDFWKIIALKRIKEILKPGGKFFLFDVVFSFPVERSHEYFDTWIAEMRRTVGQVAEETVVHIREEFSTTEKLMDMIIAESGFTIERKISRSPFLISYVCVNGA